MSTEKIRPTGSFKQASLKVVKSDTGQNLTYIQSALREVTKFGLMIIPLLGRLFYLINGLMILFSKQKKGIHDRVANSRVLRVKPAWKMGKQLLFFGAYFLAYFLLISLISATTFKITPALP